MKYGKLFRKFFEIFGTMDLSANKVSELSKNELIYMASLLYQRENKRALPEDKKQDKELKSYVYNKMKQLTEENK